MEEKTAPKQEERSYVLIDAERLETLMRRNYALGKSLLAFEYLCSHSDRPMYLTAQGVCEVLEITQEELDECRLKQLLKVKIYRKQMMYSLYDLVILAERLARRRLQYKLSKVPRYAITPRRP